MNLEALIVLPILTSLLFRTVKGTIMCSKCRSDKKPDCASKPPTPQPCSEPGSGVIKACSTIRIFSQETGDLQQFIRSCSTSTDQNDCFNDPPGFRTCAESCYTDGCNSATALISKYWPWVLAMLHLAMNIANG